MVQFWIAVGHRFTPICAMALLIGGCPKRQTVSRVVYVQSPPSASEQAAVEPPETLVIEEPAQPEPEAKAPEVAGQSQEPAAKHTARRRRALRPDASSESEVDQPAEPASAAAGEVPALEPQKTQEEQAEQRRGILSAQEDTQKHIAALEHLQLGAGDRKTLEDARSFLAQSSRELERGELIRASNLARKAALLVSAVEQSH